MERTGCFVRRIGRHALLMTMMFLVLFSLSAKTHAAFPEKGQQSQAKKGKHRTAPRLVRDSHGSHMESGNAVRYAEDRILVKFKAGTTEESKAQLHKKHGSVKVKGFKRLNIQEVKLKKGLSVETAVRLYKADPSVLFAEPDFIVTAATVPNDTYYGSTGSWGQSYPDMWGLHKIKSAEAWDVTQGSADIVVAVVDSGLDFSHPDIQGNIWTNPSEAVYDGIDGDGNSLVDDLHGWDFVSNNNNPADDNGHGTHVSGTIAAAGNNGVGVAGVSWRAKIMPLKFLNKYGSGYSSNGAAAIVYAADKGAKVVNCSWGGGGRSQTVDDAINYAHSKGVAVVVAAGNSSMDAAEYYPAGYENVLTVGATDSSDVRAWFTNYGPAVEVSAPGVDILSLRAAGTDLYGDGAHIVGSQYYRADGTSMAAPHVSGLAALLFSQHPDWTNDQVMAQIVGTADDIADPGIGAGRINALSALSQDSPRAHVTVLGHSIHDLGNGDGAIDPGEVLNMVVRVKNYGAPTTATVTLASTDPYVTFQNGTSVIDNLNSWGAGDNAASPFVVSVSPEAPRLHTIRFTVTVTSLDGSTTTTTFDQQISAALPGWPVQTGGYAMTPTLLADIDGDGVDEVVTYSDKIYVLKGDGTSLPGWPQELPYDMSSFVPFAAGDLDGNGKQVIVLAGAEKIYAWNADGKMKAGFPVQVPGPAELSGGIVSITLSDVDGDGYQEIFAPSYWQGTAYLWRHDGTLQPGWPVSFEPSNYISFPKTTAVGDLDGDGNQELLLPAEYPEKGLVYAWHHDATPVAGWPVQLQSGANGLALADMDHDGRSKVVVTGSFLDVFNGDGTRMSGDWPQGGETAAIGDIDGDGELEIVADFWDSVYAYKRDGSVVKGWPAPTISNTLLSPSLADIDGDGGVDVVVRTGYGVYAWRGFDGTLIPGFPFTVSFSTEMGWDQPVSLGDINGDGRIDLVTGSGANDTFVYAYQLPGAYRARFAPWPMFQHDAQRTTQLALTPKILSGEIKGIVGVPFNQKLAATGGIFPYNWGIVGALPQGLSWNSSGEIYGTPLEVGESAVTLQLTDARGTTATKAATIVIQVIGIVTPSLPNGMVGNSYNQPLSAAGGTGPYSWSVADGTLPPGVVLDAVTGVVSGYPTASGTYTVTLQVTDAQGVQDSKTYKVEVSQWVMKTAEGGYPQILAADRSGNLYQAGLVLTASGGGQGRVQKYDASGAPLWQRANDWESLRELAVDGAGNLYLAGSMHLNGSMMGMVTKYDSAGTELWTAYYDGGEPYSIAVDAAGTSYVIGRPAVSYYGNDSFLLKYDANGRLQWANKTISGAGDPQNVTLDEDGNIYGNFSWQVYRFDPADGSITWSRNLGDGSARVNVDREKNFYVAGRYDNQLKKFNADGDLLWSTSFEQIHTSALDVNGNVVVASMTFNGYNVDMVTSKVDAAGNMVWSKPYGGDTDEWPHALALAKNGSTVYVAGMSSRNDNFILRYDQPLISAGALPYAMAGEPYSKALAAERGRSPYVWSLVSGDLMGLQLDSSTGVISGVPQAAGYSAVTVKVADSEGLADTRTFPLLVKPSTTEPLRVATEALPASYLGMTYDQTLKAAGGMPPYTWAVVSGRIPAGLRLDPSTGRVTGEVAEYGDFNITVSVVDADGASASKDVALTIFSPVYIVTGNFPPAYIGSSYELGFNAIGGLPPYNWFVAAGALPDGLVLDPATGLLSGTPAASGTFDFSIGVADANGVTSVTTRSIDVYAPVRLETAPLPVAYQGIAIEHDFAASGGVAPYHWFVYSGTLPFGLQLDEATGKLSGTPSAPGIFQFTIGVDDVNGSHELKSFSVTVNLPVVMEAVSLHDPYVGYGYDRSFSASGGVAPYSWSVLSGSLPAGLVLDGATGRLSGIPTAAGPYEFVVGVADVNGVKDAKTISLTVHEPVVLAPLSLRPAYVGIGYDQTLVASGGVAPYGWSVVPGALPAGVMLDPATGRLSGIPAISGSFEFTVLVVDANGVGDVRAFSLVVNQPVVMATVSLKAPYVGMGYEQSFAAWGGVAPYRWSVASGSLPAGLVLDPASGRLSGIPAVSGSFEFALEVVDVNGVGDVRAFSIVVNRPVVMAAVSLQAPYVGVGYDQSFVASGGVAPYRWSVASGALPAGLVLDPASGRLSGIPAVSGSFTFTVGVVDANGAGDTKSFSINVSEPVRLETASVQTGYLNTAYEEVLISSGGVAPYRWSIVSGQLPSGLSLDAAAGRIYGAPAVLGTFTFSVGVADLNGVSDTRSYVIIVERRRKK